MFQDHHLRCWSCAQVLKQELNDSIQKGVDFVTKGPIGS